MLTLGLPSKGRLQEQCANWLKDVGFKITRDWGERGYTASLSGVDGVEVFLYSPREIALGLLSGTLHVGITGHDLLADLSPDMDQDVSRLAPLGFGKADCVVAVPQSWVDVRTMADLEDVAARERRRTGDQLRVATKYMGMTRRFFAKAGLNDYRIIESHGATEGAPASGSADIIVDITTTGNTLAANHLKILDDGLILRSQATLAASLNAAWPEAVRAPLCELIDAIEARQRGKAVVEVRCDPSPTAADVAARFGATPSSGQPHTADRPVQAWLCSRAQCRKLAAALRDETGAAVQIVDVEYCFTTQSGAYHAFMAQLAQHEDTVQ